MLDKSTQLISQLSLKHMLKVTNLVQLTMLKCDQHLVYYAVLGISWDFKALVYTCLSVTVSLSVKCTWNLWTADTLQKSPYPNICIFLKT